MALRSLVKVTLVALAAQRVAADCVSFGVDFQDGGEYFQNSLSTDPFTFVSQFEGCENVTAYNYLVDPNGDQYLCSNTDMQPDDTDELSTCPIDKDQLFSGDWTIVVFSNDGDGDPLAAQRDFSLDVGPQQTVTTTPTVTVSTTTVPLTSTTSTTTLTTTVVAATPTTTVPSKTVTRTYKVTPSKVTITTTSVLYTTTKIKAKVSVVKTTTYVTPICHLPTVATTTDKTCNIQLTIGPAASTSSAAAKLRFRRDANGPYLDKEEFVKQRREYLAARHAIVKRAPDVATVTVTDPNTSDYATTTTTIVQPTVTATFVNTASTTTTTTPATVTIVKGKTTAPAVTTTLPTPTRTVVKYTVISTTISTTYYPTVTITKKTTPASLKSACRTAGGILF